MHKLQYYVIKMRMDVRVNCVVESVWILHFRTGDTFASYPRRFLTTAKQHYYYIIINHGDEEYIDAWPHSGYTFFLVTRMRIQRFLVFFFLRFSDMWWLPDYALCACRRRHDDTHIHYYRRHGRWMRFAGSSRSMHINLNVLI